MSTVHIAGLGPGGPGLLTEETRALLSSGVRVMLRTRRHPTVEALDLARTWESCDDLYATGGGFAAVYEAIGERVRRAADEGDLVFAVPGHPLVQEATVPPLIESLRGAGHHVVVHPAVSYLDVAAVAVERDLDGIQLCDGLALRIDPRRPAVVGQVHDRAAASQVKLALLELYPAAHGVALLHALGTAEQSVRWQPLEALDREPTAYLDSLYVPPLALEADLRHLDAAGAIVERLHAEGGCPWDREQTHSSLRKYLLEEAYELIEAIDSGDPERIAEEAGDVLLQVLMHANVGEREGTFAIGDVTETLIRKLIRRHPHVFGDVEVSSAAEVATNWEAIKRAERPERRSSLDGVPAALPSLATSQAIQGRARKTGFDWPGMDGPLEKLAEEVGEFARAARAEREEEFGDILFVLAGIGARLGVDAEQALFGANLKFRRRFEELERTAAAEGIDLATAPLETHLSLWARAKAAAG